MSYYNVVKKMTEYATPELNVLLFASAILKLTSFNEIFFLTSRLQILLLICDSGFDGCNPSRFGVMDHSHHPDHYCTLTHVLAH
jgi:hypothetical protein